MANLKMKEEGKVETPSQAIVRSANEVVTVTDANGRSIGIKRLGPVERMRMFKVIGGEQAKNDAYLGIAALAFLVRSIDGDTINQPTSELQLEGLVQRLGDDGLNAVGQGVVDHFQETQEESTEALKNS